MKNLKAGILISMLTLSSCVSTQEQPTQKLKQKTHRTKTIIKKSNSKKTKTQQFKKNRAISKKRLLAKETFLPENYYKPKKSKRELEKKFSVHLEKLKQTCEKQEDKKEFLKSQLESFHFFLTTTLKDPNMDYNLQILFSDIADLIEDKNYDNFIDLDTFSSLYKSFYNLPEKLEAKNYPDDWAKIISESIQCSS